MSRNKQNFTSAVYIKYCDRRCEDVKQNQRRRRTFLIYTEVQQSTVSSYIERSFQSCVASRGVNVFMLFKTVTEKHIEQNEINTEKLSKRRENTRFLFTI